MQTEVRELESQNGVPVRLALAYTSVRGIGHAGTKEIDSVVPFLTVTVVENLIGLFDVTCDVAV
jgi:hypothetical protein